MLVQLYRDNYQTIPQEYLVYEVYDGYYDGDINSGIFNEDYMTTGFTNDLTSLETATGGFLDENSTNKSVKIYGYFRATNSGKYRFFTDSRESSQIYIDNNLLVFNTNSSIANTIDMVEGQYYKLDIYFGVYISGIPRFSAGFDFVKYYPPKAFTSDSNLVVSDFSYGNGTYSIDKSSITSHYVTFRAFDKTENEWISANAYSSSGVYGGGQTTTLTDNTPILGEWISIKLPSPIILNSFLLRSRNNSNPRIPKSIVVAGRNGSDDWTKLYEEDRIDDVVNDADDIWSINETIVLNPIVATAFSEFRLIITATKNTVNVAIGEWELYEDDNVPSITNATGLTVYYNINPETQPTLTTSDYPLVIDDDTLQGRFMVSPLALYFNRTNFSTAKYDIFYITSDELFNNFNGTYKNYIQLHEKPIAGDNERKRFIQFSSDMSFECELNGRIEVRFRRGDYEPVTFRYAMLVLDVERIPVKKI